jgi:prophage tail gpP-like protein
MTSDDEVAILVGAKKISGWMSVRIVRGIEVCPSQFEIAFTDRFPTVLDPRDALKVVVKAGDPCVVTIGGDAVVTGYVDRSIAGYTARGHDLAIAGRGKCEDLVDCSVEWPGGQIGGTNALDIAKKLAQPYGITVKALSAAGPAIPQFNLELTSSPMSIIEEICRYARLLAYEGTDGNLILSQTGTTTSASGVREGVNVLAARATFTMDNRFSEIQVYLNSMETLGPMGFGGNLLDRETDTEVPRHRRKSIIAEAPSGSQDIATKRAKWEINRRRGRSVQVAVTVDNWRDDSGKLWTPNTLVDVSLPSLDIDKISLTLASVTFLRDVQEGTRADLLLMHPQAFEPEPILLQPLFPGLRT